MIDELQRDALDPNASIAATLRKLIALGGEVGSTELRNWASRELRGYVGTGIEIPPYRRPSAIIEINGFAGGYQITGQPISPRHLPEGVREHVDEEVPLAHPIGEVEGLLAQAEANGGHVKMTLPSSQDVVSLMNYDRREQPFQKITAVYWSVSQAALQGVLDQVRTTLVELVAEMRAGMPEDAAKPSADIADQAVHVAVHGRRSRVNVTTAQACGTGSHEVSASPSHDEGGWLPRRIGAALVGAATIAGTLIALAAWQDWSLPF